MDIYRKLQDFINNNKNIYLNAPVIFVSLVSRDNALVYLSIIVYENFLSTMT